MVENLRLLRPDVVEPPSRDRVLWNGCGDPGQTKWEAWSVDRCLTCEPWSLKYYIGDFHVINLFVLDCIGECEGKLQLKQVSGRTQAKKTAAPEDCYLEVSSLVHMRNHIDSYSPIQGLHVVKYILLYLHIRIIYIYIYMIHVASSYTVV